MPEDRRPRRITRRAVLVGGGAAAALAACSGRAAREDDASGDDPGAGRTAPRRAAEATTTEAAPPDGVHRVLADGEHFPDGLVVPAGETWAFAEGASVTSARNVVVEGTLRLHQPDPSRTMRLTFVDVDESAFVGGDAHEVVASDVGLWVVGQGRLDVQGAQKTSWTRLTTATQRGAREILVEDASGWRVGDEVAVTATAGRSVEGYYAQFDRTVVASVSGNRIGLEHALAYEHPTVNGRWNAEVLNLTRSVVIEGTPEHRAHIIHLHQGMTAPADFRASAISNLELAHLGPNQPNDRDEPSSVLGRYALHWHHGLQSTDGVVVDGVVAHDCGAHVFVAHTSDGITFRNCASHASLGDPFWWDPGEPSEYITYDRCIASDVVQDGRSRYTTSGFFAARSDQALSCTMRGCVAAGVQGPDSGGFIWINGSLGVWVFEDCLAHNLEHDGLSVWQNTSVLQQIDRFTAYNCDAGIRHGAYVNPYRYHGVTVHDCGAGLAVSAVSGDEGGVGLEFHDVVASACDTDVVLEDAPVDAMQPTDFRRCQLARVIVNATHTDTQKRWDFIDCGLQPEDFEIEELAGDVEIRTQADGQAWRLTHGADWSATAGFS
jgi:hypothetical protein